MGGEKIMPFKLDVWKIPNKTTTINIPEPYIKLTDLLVKFEMFPSRSEFMRHIFWEWIFNNFDKIKELLSLIDKEEGKEDLNYLERHGIKVIREA